MWKKSREQNTLNGGAKTAEQTQQSAPGSDAPASLAYARMKARSTPIRRVTALTTPLRAAASDVALMSQHQPQQQSQSLSGTDVFNSQWERQVDFARTAWARLSKHELLKSEGNEQTLIRLIRQRYAITRDEASNQVKSFIEQCLQRK